MAGRLVAGRLGRPRPALHRADRAHRQRLHPGRPARLGRLTVGVRRLLGGLLGRARTVPGPVEQRPPARAWFRRPAPAGLGPVQRLVLPAQLGLRHGLSSPAEQATDADSIRATPRAPIRRVFLIAPRDEAPARAPARSSAVAADEGTNARTGLGMLRRPGWARRNRTWGLVQRVRQCVPPMPGLKGRIPRRDRRVRPMSQATRTPRVAAQDVPGQQPVRRMVRASSRTVSPRAGPRTARAKVAGTPPPPGRPPRAPGPPHAPRRGVAGGPPAAPRSGPHRWSPSPSPGTHRT